VIARDRLLDDVMFYWLPGAGPALPPPPLSRGLS
jgi:hypothetical protein